MDAQVRYNSWYVSSPSSAKQQREMTKLCVVWRTWTTTAIFLNFYFKFVAVSQNQFRDSFGSDKQSNWLKSIARFVGKNNMNSLFNRGSPWRRRSSFFNSLRAGSHFDISISISRRTQKQYDADN